MVRGDGQMRKALSGGVARHRVSVVRTGIHFFQNVGLVEQNMSFYPYINNRHIHGFYVLKFLIVNYRL